MFESAYIELSRSALKSNLRFLRRRMGDRVRISSVIKGNAYGHGIEEMVQMLCQEGVDHYSVFSANEAVRVQNACSRPHDVMIMGEVHGDALEWAIEQGISFFVFNRERLEDAVRISKKINKKARLHIELETGMNRTGFDLDDLEKVAKTIEQNKDYLEFEGLCTHYAGAESIANYLRIQRQIRRFRKGFQYFNEHGLRPEFRHTSCSAAAMMYPKTRYDLVRIGIMQYGFWPSQETFIQFVMNRAKKEDPLKRVISWKSKIMALKEVQHGEFIGYGQSFLARENMRTAVVPIGYAHGYTRELSNQGRLLIGGHRVGVVGMVNMNMLMADVTEIPNAKVGDEVVLIGKQGEMDLSVASFGELSNQLNYELLTRLPGNIPRKIVS